MGRQLWVLLHRWVGLSIAAFLTISGVTGAIISWDHELDELLNAHLTHVDSRGPYLSALALGEEIEARDPRVITTYVPLFPEEGKALVFGVWPKQDPATGKLYEVDYNEVFVDPVTGKELGRRYWGAPWPVTRENFVSFLYVLHYSLHIPAFWGIDLWGLWLLGVVAIFWTLDCFVGFYLTLPQKRRVSRDAEATADEERPGKTWMQRWAPAWKVRWKSGATKVNFDIHRAFSLWTWVLLFIIAFTGFSLNLYYEVFYPMMSTVSEVTPGPYDLREPHPLDAPEMPLQAYPDVIARAEQDAARRGWTAPAGGIYYAPDYGIYEVSFFEMGEDHGFAGAGTPALQYDNKTGAHIGEYLPWTGTAADLFVQAQFPLHSGRILGIPGRILISIMGLVVAALSVTGVVIWWKKSKARVVRASRETSVATGMESLSR